VRLEGQASIQDLHAEFDVATQELVQVNARIRILQDQATALQTRKERLEKLIVKAEGSDSEVEAKE
jgi:prefoldin subunit 5